MPLLGIVIDPLRRQPIQIAADAELHGRTFERVAEGGFAPVALIGLLAGAADIHLGDPLLAETQPELADDGTIRQDFVFILPAFDAEHVIETVLDDASVHKG